MTWDGTLVSIVADIITDLAAAAFAAVWILPVTAERPIHVNVGLVIFNLVLGLAALALAWRLRTLGI